MTDTSMIDKLFIGPAVVVDDDIGKPGYTMQPIIDQIKGQHIPVFCETTIPPDEEIKHWRGFSLIVLDWDLFPVTLDLDERQPGLALPDTLSDANNQTVAQFVRKLLEELYCPIFIFSSHPVETIEGELAKHLPDKLLDIKTRILIRRKGDLTNDLFGELKTWVSGHSAIYALKSWDYGYEMAKKEFFSDFQKASPDWPKILWATSEKDSVNSHFELSEAITRNLLHRFPLVTFDKAVFETPEDDAAGSQEMLRRVIHRQAVIAQKSIHENVLMPGDFFFDAVDGNIPQAIFINVAPACDLVARGDRSVDTIQLTLLPANLVEDSEHKPSKFVEAIEKEKARDHSQSQIIYVLTDSARPYRVCFKEWELRTWGEMKEKRQGRLLEPYITQLQQKFALFFHRQGLPRLPDEYFYKPDTTPK